MDELSIVLERLAECIRKDAHDLAVESQCIEIKPVPATGGQWDSIRESVCAMLNTQGGTIVLGVRDERKPHRHFVHSGYDETQSGNIVGLRHVFSDKNGTPLDVSEFLQLEARPFLTGQIALLRISALTSDRKYCFHKGVAYERVVDRDETIPMLRIESQEEIKREMEQKREMLAVDDLSPDELSIQRINEYVMLLNQGQSRPIESLKSDINQAGALLRRKRFLNQDGKVTTLGALICSEHPEDELGFRCQLDAFVTAPSVVAQDKKTFRDNILQLMEAGYNWTLRNIMTGVSTKSSGTMLSEYPEKLIRESINNALAHRDYSVNRPVQITIKPGDSLNIRNPGRLPAELLMEESSAHPPIRRIFANPTPRNPRLADILKLHNKWEGKGIGMADLTNSALLNEIDLPHYILDSSELTLCIPSGKVLDESTEAWISLHDAWVSARTAGRKLTDEHRIVLAYLLKSERANRLGRFTIALTEANNHAKAIGDMVGWGLIVEHPDTREPRFQGKRVYIVARELADDDCHIELRNLFGGGFDDIDEMSRLTLNMVALAERYSSSKGLNAKQVSRLIAPIMFDEFRRRGPDEFYRGVRHAVERMSPSKKALGSALASESWHSDPLRMLSIKGPATKPTYRLNREFSRGLF